MKGVGHGNLKVRREVWPEAVGLRVVNTVKLSEHIQLSGKPHRTRREKGSGKDSK